MEGLIGFLITIVPMLAGAYALLKQKQAIHERNDFIEKRWTGEIKSDDPRVHGFLPSSVAREGQVETQELATMELNAPTFEGEKQTTIIWGATELSTIECVKQLMMLCGAFEKLGWNDFAENLRGVIKAQDFGITERSMYNWILAQTAAIRQKRKEGL